MSVGASSTLPVIGIVGGIGPESTIDYYRALLAGYARRVPDGSAPTITIQSIDLQRGLRFLDAGDMEGLTTYLVDAVAALARASSGVSPLPGPRRVGAGPPNASRSRPGGLLA